MTSRPVVLCLGTLDTKGPETGFIAESIRTQGCDAIVLDCGSHLAMALKCIRSNAFPYCLLMQIIDSLLSLFMV